MLRMQLSSGSALFANTKLIFGEDIQYFLDIITCDLDIYNGHSKFSVSNQREESISI